MSKYYRQTSSPASHGNRNGDSITRSNSSSYQTDCYDSQKYKKKYHKTKSYNKSSNSRVNYSSNSNASHHEPTDHTDNTNNNYTRSKSLDTSNDSGLNRSSISQSKKSFDTNIDYDDNNEYNDSNLTLNNSSNIYYSRNRNRFKSDKPLFSRLFILCSRETTEQELKEAFQKFGEIQDIWIVRDHNTNMEKGLY
jgi:hypothetical protein